MHIDCWEHLQLTLVSLLCCCGLRQCIAARQGTLQCNVRPRSDPPADTAVPRWRNATHMQQLMMQGNAVQHQSAGHGSCRSRKNSSVWHTCINAASEHGTVDRARCRSASRNNSPAASQYHACSDINRRAAIATAALPLDGLLSMCAGDALAWLSSSSASPSSCGDACTAYIDTTFVRKLRICAVLLCRTNLLFHPPHQL